MPSQVVLPSRVSHPCGMCQDPMAPTSSRPSPFPLGCLFCPQVATVEGSPAPRGSCRRGCLPLQAFRHSHPASRPATCLPPAPGQHVQSSVPSARMEDPGQQLPGPREVPGSCSGKRGAPCCTGPGANPRGCTQPTPLTPHCQEHLLWCDMRDPRHCLGNPGDQIPGLRAVTSPTDSPIQWISNLNASQGG